MWSNRKKKKPSCNIFQLGWQWPLCFPSVLFWNAILLFWWVGFFWDWVSLFCCLSLNFCIHGNKSEGRKGRYWKVGEGTLNFLSPASPLSVLSLGTNRHHVCHNLCFFYPKTRLVLNFIGRWSLCLYNIPRDQCNYCSHINFFNY